MAASAPSLANLPDQKDFAAAAAEDDLVENGGVESFSFLSTFRDSPDS
jgi:hypothetical protein